MTLEFHHWPANTEITLVDDDGRVKDSFYTAANHFYEDTAYGMYDGMRAQDAFEMLENSLPAPNVAGSWAEHHAAMRRYREKHPAAKVDIR
jgi:hypothetical protein